MSKNKRWGKEFIDKRDWKKYNDEVVRRYEMYLDLDWVASWAEELKQMNKGKVGKPFEYPNSMIYYQSLLTEKFSTRGAEAITKKLVEYNLIPQYNDHSTIHERILKLDLKFKIPKTKLRIATDGSGFKMTNSGEYKQNKYGQERRKFAKVIITGTKKDILEVDVFINGKNVSEPKTAKKHHKIIRTKGGIIDKVEGDGAFDTKDLFNDLEENKIKRCAIRIRKDASTKARGSLRRKREVKKFKKLGYKTWSKETGYGHRWPKTEGHFSGIKRTLGDASKAKLAENIITELRRKVWIYDQLRKYGRNEIKISG